MKRALLRDLQDARTQKRPIAVVTQIATGLQSLVTESDVRGDLDLRPPLLADVRQRLKEDRSGTITDGDLFVHVHNPPLRMLIVGAVHIAQALVPMARLAGYDVAVIDPRRAWATLERFPDVDLVSEWPDDAMRTHRPDSRTAVVTLTHDPKLDDPALLEALASPAFYIGALGSTRTHARRLDRLREQGMDEVALTRIHGPIGLAIGAKSPAEIALAILGQVTQVLHRAPPLVKGPLP